MTFKVKFESVNQHVMLLADLMSLKVKFESESTCHVTGVSNDVQGKA